MILCDLPILKVGLEQGPLNRWTSQFVLGNTTGRFETVVSVHNSK